MNTLNPFTSITAAKVAEAAAQHQTPFYLYDEALLLQKCRRVLHMPNPYGLTVRFAMKANSTRAILRLIHSQGVKIDASSLNEARRAHLAGIPCEDIMLTTQEVPHGEDRALLESMLCAGMRYNVCSLRQMERIAPFAAAQKLSLSVRVHPGVGAGESVTRNTGDDYSCFGVHLTNLKQLLAVAEKYGLQIGTVHAHIGSGGDPEAWRENIDLQLGILETFFPHAHSVSFGGGLKEARMPDENAADVEMLGKYASVQLEAFALRTGRQLHMEVEPGTYLVANCGYVVTTVLDKKRTGEQGLSFVIADGGMEVNARPLLYGSRHPFYMVSRGGELLSSEFSLPETDYKAVLVGRCCESGDAQSLDEAGRSLPRTMAQPEIGDYTVIGGAGAYCSAMTPFNYNSHEQIAELLVTQQGALRLIRKRQSLEQIIQNELD